MNALLERAVQMLEALPDDLREQTSTAQQTMAAVCAELTGVELSGNEVDVLVCRAHDVLKKKRHPRPTQASNAGFASLRFAVARREGQKAMEGAIAARKQTAQDPDVVRLDDELTLTERTEKTSRILARVSRDRVYRRGNGLLRLRTDDKAVNIEALNPDALLGEVARAVKFMKYDDERWADVRVNPPALLVKTLFTWPDYSSFRVLEGLTPTPFITPSGTVAFKPGYEEETGVYLADTLEFGEVPDAPSGQDVQEALALLREPFVDFPFCDEASSTHALSAILTPIVRNFIPGPTPIFAVDASQEGTGKGLLIDVISLILTGKAAAMDPFPENEEEVRKKILPLVLDGSGIAVFDNIDRRVDSAALAAATTGRVWRDRILGQSKVIEHPIRNLWVLTGNNLTFSREISRRVVWVRLMADVPDPSRREGFKHPKLVEWVTENRGALFRAAMILVRNWLAQGRPSFPGPQLGSYEDWVSVIGGVLGAAGVTGFLSNRAEQDEEADIERGSWGLFVEEWWRIFGSATKSSEELLPYAEGAEVITGEEEVTERAKVTALGILLGKHRGRVWNIGAGLLVRLAKAQRGGGSGRMNPSRGWCLALVQPPKEEKPIHEHGGARPGAGRPQKWASAAAKMRARRAAALRIQVENAVTSEAPPSPAATSPSPPAHSITRVNDTYKPFKSHVEETENRCFKVSAGAVRGVRGDGGDGITPNFDPPEAGADPLWERFNDPIDHAQVNAALAAMERDRVAARLKRRRARRQG